MGRSTNKKKKLTSVKLSNFMHVIMFGSKHIGHAVKDVDGFFYFDSGKKDGIWDAWALRAIADLIDDLNKDWNEFINKNLKSPKD